MPYTFNQDRFTDVRAAIGLDVDIRSLPDEVLALNIYQGEAERYIERNLTQTQWEAKVEEAEYASALYLASLVVPNLRVVTKENIVGGSMTYANVDLQAIAKDLRDRAAGRVNDIIEAQGGTPAEPSGVNLVYFGTAKARRYY